MNPDRLWTRPSTLTDDDREQVRRAILANPAILEGPIRAALACTTEGDDIAASMLAEIRRVQRCAQS